MLRPYFSLTLFYSTAYITFVRILHNISSYFPLLDLYWHGQFILEIHIAVFTFSRVTSWGFMQVRLAKNEDRIENYKLTYNSGRILFCLFLLHSSVTQFCTWTLYMGTPCFKDAVSKKTGHTNEEPLQFSNFRCFCFLFCLFCFFETKSSGLLHNDFLTKDDLEFLIIVPPPRHKITGLSTTPGERPPFTTLMIVLFSLCAGTVCFPAIISLLFFIIPSCLRKGFIKLYPIPT